MRAQFLLIAFFAALTACNGTTRNKKADDAAAPHADSETPADDASLPTPDVPEDVTDDVPDAPLEDVFADTATPNPCHEQAFSETMIPTRDGKELSALVRRPIDASCSRATASG